MNDIDWCKRHLNWAFGIGVVALALAAQFIADKLMGNLVATVAIVIAFWFGFGLLSKWVLREKGHDGWHWLVLSFLFLLTPVLLSNKRGV